MDAPLRPPATLLTRISRAVFPAPIVTRFFRRLHAVSTAAVLVAHPVVCVTWAVGNAALATPIKKKYTQYKYSSN